MPGLALCSHPGPSGPVCRVATLFSFPSPDRLNSPLLLWPQPFSPEGYASDPSLCQLYVSSFPCRRCSPLVQDFWASVLWAFRGLSPGSLWGGAVPCTAGCVAASLGPCHYPSVAPHFPPPPPIPRYNNLQCLQTLLTIPLGQNCPVENHCSNSFCFTCSSCLLSIYHVEDTRYFLGFM